MDGCGRAYALDRHISKSGAARRAIYIANYALRDDLVDTNTGLEFHRVFRSDLGRALSVAVATQRYIIFELFNDDADTCAVLVFDRMWTTVTVWFPDQRSACCQRLREALDFCSDRFGDQVHWRETNPSLEDCEDSRGYALCALHHFIEHVEP